MSGLISIISSSGIFGSGTAEIVVTDQMGISYYFTEGNRTGGNFNTALSGLPMFVLGNSAPTMGEIYVRGTAGPIRGSMTSGTASYNQPLGGMALA
ncbi:MAG: hypothetical protein GTN36_05305 [Candidatus Aenigmarchaeota archaeon]|nr:hypothetical protein [Candidatus Aenigmarchaeota archaeon]